MDLRLEDLACKFGVDKLFAHSYIGYYEKLFTGRKVKKILEIGIGYEHLMRPFVPHYIHGASLKMFSEYWPDAQIYGCDIREDTLFQEGNIHTFLCDQSNPIDLLKGIGITGGCLDIIIDDGSHEIEHQILTAKTLLPYLALSGVYVIEDCRDPDHVAREVMGTPIKFPPRIDHRPDDALVVIQPILQRRSSGWISYF